MKLTANTANVIGLWFTRALLVAGAVVLAFNGNDKAAATCASVCVISFVLL